MPILRAVPLLERISRVCSSSWVLREQIGARVTVLPFGGDVIEEVARGRFEIGVSQSSEIVAHPGVTLVGRLPAPYVHRTRYLAAKLIGAGAAPTRAGSPANPGRALRFRRVWL